MLKCCICGKEIHDEVHDACNPDPLKDENGKFLSETDNPYCCSHCDKVYVLSARIAEAYNLPDQFKMTQERVLNMRKFWRN